MFSKIEFQDSRGWRISFAHSGPRRPLDGWTFAIHFRDLLVQPALGLPRDLALHLVSNGTDCPDGEMADMLIGQAEMAARDELPHEFLTANMSPSGPRYAKVKIYQLPEIYVPIALAEEVIGEGPEITLGQAVVLVNSHVRNPDLPRDDIFEDEQRFQNLTTWQRCKIVSDRLRFRREFLERGAAFGSSGAKGGAA